MNKKQTNYLIIIIITSLILILILVGKDHLYGSQIDWINQHTTIPDLFRNLFYETHKLIPNFIFNLGAGQNIFNFSYYGLTSPIILISYFLPFIKIETFISISSIVIYILTGVLLFEFLIRNKASNRISLFATLAFQCMAPITFQFHHHIMFVWYLPFLVLALFGVDKYLEKNKSLLLIISICLIILTNYYYSVPSLLTIIIYGCYKIIEKGNNSFKKFIITCLKASIRIIIPILMTSFILLPTALTMFKMGRNTESVITLSSLIFPNIKEISYSAFGIGLSFILLIAPFGNLCHKKIKAEDIFLNLSLIIITLCPIFMYLLNGKLYIRGKVLIPITIIYILVFVKFITALKEDKIKETKLYEIIGIITIILVLSNFHNMYTIAFSLDVVISVISLILFRKFKKTSIIYLPLIITLLVSSLCNNYTEIYLPENINEDIQSVEKLLEKKNDNSFYRTDTLIDSNKNANRICRNDYYSTTIYSSTYNSYYHDFYTSKIGNNIEHRNILNSSGANNYLFNKMMGVKYIISSRKHNDNYKKVTSKNNINLYKNDNANPLIFTTTTYGSTKKYNSLAFPYNVEYLVNNQTTESNSKIKYSSTIEKISIGEKSSYKLDLKKDKKINYRLPEPIRNKILIISFDMQYNQSCSEGDTIIKINGIKNKLTCKEWQYHNKNNNFKYIITNKQEYTDLNIKLSKGKYHINNIKIYTMAFPTNNYQEISNLKINKKKSIITGTTNEKETSYLITSFPYDKGFTAYIDNHKVKSEIVNTSFLGFKVPKGSHKIKIKYSSPGYQAGLIISLIGSFSMCGLVLMEANNHK